jgi:putative membrane protein
VNAIAPSAVPWPERDLLEARRMNAAGRKGGKAELPPVHRGTEYLANERTYLAWIRTSLAFLSVGFVLMRLSVSIGPQSGRGAAVELRHMSSPFIGTGMTALGAALAVFAAWRHHVVNAAIDRGEARTDPWLIVLVTVLVVLLAGAMILIGRS